MELARKWARLGGWLGIIWPCLFVGVMIAAELVGPKTHSAAEDLVAWTDPHNRRVDMLLHTFGGMVGLLGIGWCLGLNEWLQGRPIQPHEQTRDGVRNCWIFHRHCHADCARQRAGRHG